MSRSHRRRLLLLAVGVATVLVALVTPALAAPPANDAFAAAQPLAGESGSVTGTNAEATREAGEPEHLREAGGRSVWYRWTAPRDGLVLFETCTSTGFDTVLAAYTGSTVSGLSRLTGSDDDCGEQSRMTFSAATGTTYSIAVDGYENATGTFTLGWRLVTAPANDNFASAQSLTGATGTVTGESFGARSEPGEPAPTNAASVWYAWTAPLTGGAGFQTCGSSFDTILTAFTGSAVNALTPVATGDDECRLQTRIRFLAREGTTYPLRIYGDSGTAGAITLAWAAAPRPANDNYQSARLLRGERGSVSGSNAGALGESGEAALSASMWYRWRSPRTMGVAFETCRQASFDTVVGVFRGRTLRSAAQLKESDDACPGDRSRVVFVATRNTEYRIRVDGYRGETGSFSLRWSRASAFAEPCRVPDVRGLTLARARETLSRENCSLGRIAYARSAIVPRGRVISQFPTPGTRLRLLGRVNLELSRGA